MPLRPTYEELKKRVQELEQFESEHSRTLEDFAQMFSMSLDLICIADINTTKFLKVNPAFTEILGYSEKDLLEKPFFEFIHPEDLDSTQSVVEKKLQQGMKVINFENRYRCQDGSYLWLSWVSHPDPDQGITYAIARDITELKLAQQTLALNEERLNLALDSVSDAVWDWSVDTGEVYFSSRWYTMLGYEPYELPQEFETWRKLVHPDDLPVSEKTIFNHLELAKSFQIEFRMRTKNGQWRWILARGKTVKKDAKGKAARMLGTHMDITDRKLAERALIDSESKWKNILVNTPQIGISLNSEAKIIFVNTHFLNLTGWKEKEVLGRDWFDMFIPEHLREEVREVFFAVMGQKDTAGFSTYENQILDRNGGLINVAWSNVLTKDTHGNVVDVTCLGVDLTERRRSETALKESEAYMRSIFRAAPTGIGVVNDRVFRQINDKFCEMLGYSMDELIGQQSLLVYPSIEEFEKVGREKYEQIKEKGTGTVETVMKRKNGRLINVLMSSTPIEINDLSAGVTFTALDITESKQAEKALKESHERFFTVLESIDATIYVADMKTHEILFMNKHMINSFGRDLTGEICWHAFRGESKPCKHCNNDKLINENGIPKGVISWQGKNPKTGKWYVNYDRAIEWTDGRLVRLQIATDITDLKKMEEQLRQAQKMESVGRLAGGVAHDFNNMLSIILGNTEMILEDLDKTNPVIKNLHEIYKAAERSTNLTRQLLAFARKQTISPKELDLNEAIEGMLKMLRRLIGENIDLVWLPKNNLWMIKFDPSQADQILANLCVNARDSIKDVGKVTIETDNVSFDSDYCCKHDGFKPGDYVMTAVSDNGCGMSKEILGNLFEPFFTTKGVGEGTGLGLATVYGIVKQNNGFINVYSEPDKGTTFRIYFPKHAENNLPKQNSDAKKVDARGHETILLVEDEEAILRMDNNDA